MWFSPVPTTVLSKNRRNIKKFQLLQLLQLSHVPKTNVHFSTLSMLRADLAATGWHFICISPYECGEIVAKQDGEEQMDRQTLGL